MPGGPYFKFEEDYPPASDQWYSLLEAQQKEQDPESRAAIIKDFQRYAASKMYIIPTVGHATRFQVGWNWVGNFGTFEDRGGPVA